MIEEKKHFILEKVAPKSKLKKKKSLFKSKKTPKKKPKKNPQKDQTWYKWTKRLELQRKHPYHTHFDFLLNVVIEQDVWVDAVVRLREWEGV